MNVKFNRAIIDTCVLLDALMINYMRFNNNKSINRKWEAKIFRENIFYKENYIRFLNDINTFITTSHVIGELQGLVNSKLGIEDDFKISFWKTSISYLGDKNLDEKFIELLVLGDNQYYAKCIHDIGYVDTGLIDLARREKLTIITKDNKTLINRAKQFEFLTFNPEERLISKFR